MTSRVREALNTLPPSDALSLPQAAFNFLNDGYIGGATERALMVALDRWAETVLGPEEKGNGGGRWADDGGGNQE